MQKYSCGVIFFCSFFLLYVFVNIIYSIDIFLLRSQIITHGLNYALIIRVDLLGEDLLANYFITVQI